MFKICKVAEHLLANAYSLIAHLCLSDVKNTVQKVTGVRTATTLASARTTTTSATPPLDASVGQDTQVKADH